MRSLRDDRVLRALADPHRRRVLELLRETPGMNASQLAARFRFSRIALVKHLQTLEASGLVTRRREGRAVALFAHDEAATDALSKHLERCAPLWRRRLVDLKRELESEHPPAMTAPKHVYVTFIRTTREKLWDALTRPEMTRKYFFGTDIRTRLEPGAPIEYVMKTPDGAEQVPVAGTIVEVVPLQRLVHTFRFHGRAEPESRVAFDIEAAGAGTCKLTVTHDGFAEDGVSHTETGGGWPVILSGLKTLLETGSPLAIE